MAAEVLDRYDSHISQPVKLTGEPTSSSSIKAKDNTTTLKSKWPAVQDLFGSTLDLPSRFEGEIADLVVLGELPKELDGTFYRIMVDPFVPPCEGNVPLDGDGNISAMRFHNGKVDLKTRYVETQRYLIEKKAGKAMFGLYRNPFSHHPCVRAAVDSTANTNLVGWGGYLLALKESALPYAVDFDTLETLKYDPFSSTSKLKAKTFSAHPKYDPYKDELVVYGYEAKGLATNDIVTYTIDRKGEMGNVFWLKDPFPEGKPGLIHDCAITKNWILLFVWPFEASVERMKKGGHHWAWSYERGHTIIVVPRNKNKPLAGWKPSETRYYEWKNCMAIHTAGAWEDPSDPSKIWVESSRVHDNAFPFFPPDDGTMPAADAKADFVRWHIDACNPSGTFLQDPQIVLDIPAEFPRIDERFMGRPYDHVWLNVFMPDESDGGKNVYHGLNGLAQHSHKTGKTQFFYAGDDSLTQEPIFVPRNEKAEEGDGWVMSLIERRKENRCDVVVLDTREFERPVAMIQLPMRLKSQVHGNWISSKELGGYKPLVREVGDFEMIRGGALEPLV